MKLDRTPMDVESQYAPLPGSATLRLVEFAKGAGGRSDDCIVHLTDVHGGWIGSLTVGWFREHTELAEYEGAD